MNVQQDGDRLVDAYLKYLTKAAEPLPESRRTDLLADVTSHIAEARAAGATSEDDVRRMLQRLGDPDDLVAASTDGLVLVDRYRPTFRGREVLALTLLALGGFLVLVGWVVGAVLLWTSDRWTRGEKWLGTLVWPFGFVFVYFIVTLQTGFTLPVWLGIPIAILVGLAPLVVLGLLIKNARPGRSTQAS
ncbi:HAAS signaling domain-containing protein [Kribbella sp. NPDC055110]